MSSPLHKFKILIADSDFELAQISKQMLKGMGFADIQVTQSGNNALTMIKTQPYDFVITDWRLRDIDGIRLINHIRRDPDSPNPTMPVIMLTGRMEQADVQTARDHGIHEYVVKPFTAKSLYNRLERIVEAPRYFIAGKNFVGPDRRNRQGPPPGTAERRKKVIAPKRKPWEGARAIQSGEPQLWMPDMSLKHKLGHNVSLESIITPAILSQAQAAIDSGAQEAQRWVKNDLAELENLCAMVTTSREPAPIIAEMCEVALSISARAGTFGFTRGSEVAYMLYLFFRNKFNPRQDRHATIIAKHVQVLHFTFDRNIRDDSGDIMLILRGLKDLTTKYTA